MRAGGMLRKRSTFAIVIAPVFALFLVARVNALPLQYLPDIPDYIPVYIRYGDQPLEEINPDLAEAFHESTGISNRIQDTALNDLPYRHSSKDLIDRNYRLLNAKDENSFYKNDKIPFTIKQSIFITPQEKPNSLQKSKLPEHKFIAMKMHKFLPIKKSNFKKIGDDTEQ